MKVNEIVVEALPGGGTLSGIAKELSKKIGGDANHYATWGDHNNPKFFGKRYDPLAGKKGSAPAPVIPPEQTDPTDSEKSKLLKDFEIVDYNPLTVRWKNKDFQRNKFGEWRSLDNKPPTEQVGALLDRISPPPKNQGMADPFNKPKAPKYNTGSEKPAVWRQNPQRVQPSQTQPQPTQPTEPQAPAKVRITRNTDGSINVVDKLGKTWKSAADGSYWTDGTSIFRPGSEQFEKLNSLNKNLKENRALPK